MDEKDLHDFQDVAENYDLYLSAMQENELNSNGNFIWALQRVD